MSSPPKRKEAPTEPLKRAIGLCVRAIAGHSDLDVGFAPGTPEYSPKHVQLPEPSRVPSQREIAVIIHAPDVVAHLRSLGMEPAGGTSSAFAVRIAAEKARWRDVIVRAGIPTQP